MGKKISGIEVSKILYEELRNYLLTRENPIHVVDISIGDDFGGQMYSKMKQKKISKETGIDFDSIHFTDINKDKLESYLEMLSKDPEITGIMLQLPLPGILKDYEREILDKISPTKDVDGLTTSSIGKLVLGEDTLIPCTPKGIETLLHAYEVPLEGKKVAIINRSNIVGKPLAHLMLQNNATPIICHSKTRDLKEVTGILKLVADVERIGDHAEDIYNFATKLNHLPSKHSEAVDELAKYVIEMLKNSILAYINQDLGLANKVIDNSFLERCRFTFSMTDVFYLSTIKQERGTSYPFARTFSLGANITF